MFKKIISIIWNILYYSCCFITICFLFGYFTGFIGVEFIVYDTPSFERFLNLFMFS